MDSILESRPLIFLHIHFRIILVILLLVSVSQFTIIGIAIADVYIPAKWAKNIIYVKVVADDDISYEQITEARNIISRDPMKYREFGETIYNTWNAAFDAYRIKKHIVLTDDEAINPDITVHLVSYKDPKGTAGATTHIDRHAGIISHASITVYNSNNLGYSTYMSYINHELGHGIGLAHQNCECLMNPDGAIYSSFITTQDTDSMLRLYLR